MSFCYTHKEVRLSDGTIRSIRANPPMTQAQTLAAQDRVIGEMVSEMIRRRHLAHDRADHYDRIRFTMQNLRDVRRKLERV